MMKDKNQTLVYDFPHTIDVRDADCLRLELEFAWERAVRIEVTMVPLRIARPEFIEKTSASLVVCGNGNRTVEFPFTMFDYPQMVAAHLKYISRIEVSVKALIQPDTVDFKVIDLSFERMGDFLVSCPLTSAAGCTGDVLNYRITIENRRDNPCCVTIMESRYGKELVPFTYPDSVILQAKEQQEITIQAIMPDGIPAGGRELHHFVLIPDGVAEQAKTIQLYAAGKRQQPFLIHCEEGWETMKAALAADCRLEEAFTAEYLEPALGWSVPSPYDGPEYVYPSVSQDLFLTAGIAWKLTGDIRLKDKIIRYLKGFLDKQQGYLTTAYSYFVFIESVAEYAKGDFKVHRACDAGWVQEAEFMAKIAFVYDLVRDCGEFAQSDQDIMEKSMRCYMDFSSWRLTDGDGNNFQIAEASAGLYFALLLQDYAWIDRFLNGKNGLKDLLASVFADDGSYFEGASGYMRLVAQLLLRACIACENAGENLKDLIVPAAFDLPVIHSPWAIGDRGGEKRKPFLGMSFEKNSYASRPVRRIKDYFDNLFGLLNEQGIIFSANDSNEQNLISMFEMAYYLYRDERYLEVTRLAEPGDILFGRHMTKRPEFYLGEQSFLNTGNGFAVLRDGRYHKKPFSQAVLKFGQHGGYHGHYDRLSLLSFIKDNQTFHNMEYAWFGYDSFLFKMWVQTSVAHNMVVVDGQMQEPTPAECIYFEENQWFQAACAQTTSRWCDPPYGGQTPYPWKFPGEKCEREGRYILNPKYPRRQGEIGDYSEPVFQRRLVVLAEGCCFLWDYGAAEHDHTFDCFYHPQGRTTVKGLSLQKETDLYDSNPFGAGQYIRKCRWYQGNGVVEISCQSRIKRVNHNDIIDFVPRATLYRAYPPEGQVMIGRYPQGKDTFGAEEIVTLPDTMQDDCKKAVCFRQSGNTARFVSVLEIGNDELVLATVECSSYNKVTVTKKDGTVFSLHVKNMDNKDCNQISVSCGFDDFKER